MTNLVNRFVERATDQPDAAALRLGDATWSFGELERAARTIAADLVERGVRPGDTVGIVIPNVAAFPAIYYGILIAGGVAVPMNPLLKHREIAYYLSDSGARWNFAWHEAVGEALLAGAEAAAETMLVDSDFLEQLDGSLADGFATVERDDSDTAVILYTSGTTGHPKGAELTHSNLAVNASEFGGGWLSLTPADVVIGCLPLFHTFGQTVSMNGTLFAGGQLVLIPRFAGETVLQQIEKTHATVFVGVPTMYTAMLEAPNAGRYDVRSLRVCCSGGAPLPVEVLRGFEAAFDTVVIEGYGLSETSPIACFNPVDGVRKPGSVGIPIRGVDMRIVSDDGEDLPTGEVGEICIRGHNVMKGYLGRPDATAEAMLDDWFRTGDLGKVDDDGYFYIVDRKKSLIIRGGYNVYPREVEEVLYEHPDIVEAAVVGVPHASLGEEVAAAVVLRAGASVAPEEIGAFVKERIAAYKYPRHIWIVDELPKGPTGKILRREVRIAPSAH